MHVRLRVAAVHTQGVELHELAAVILVEATAPLEGAGANAKALRRGPRLGQIPPRGERDVRGVGGALIVVQVVEHGRTVRDSAKQVAELAEGARADHVAVVLQQRELRGHLAPEHGEMIFPEVGHYLQKLVVADDGPHQLRAENLLHSAVAKVVHGLEARAVFSRHHVWRVGGESELGAAAADEDVLLGTRIHERLDRHRDRRKAGERAVRSTIRPIFRRQLAQQPMIEPLVHDDGGFAGARAVCQAFERVLGLLIDCQLARLIVARQGRFGNHRCASAGAGGDYYRERCCRKSAGAVASQ